MMATADEMNRKRKERMALLERKWFEDQHGEWRDCLTPAEAAMVEQWDETAYWDEVARAHELMAQDEYKRETRERAWA